MMLKLREIQSAPERYAGKVDVCGWVRTVRVGKTMGFIMPVMMFFIFRGLPSGLVLYYTVYSIFSAIQQYRLQKKIKTKETITK